MHFNSSLVRLEVSAVCISRCQKSIFQFQFGSIGSWPSKVNTSTSNSFQFQFGSIGSLRKSAKRLDTTFISIPVWFDWKLNSEELTVEISSLFQFQFGSIGRTWTIHQTIRQVGISIPVWFDWKQLAEVEKNLKNIFQFQFGSIGSWTKYLMLIRMTKISIPVWFDWKIILKKLPANTSWYFNSSLVRLEDFGFSPLPGR